MAGVTTKTHLTVSDAASEVGVSVDTLRRWEKKGLIRAARGAHGERLFDRRALRALAQKGAGRGKWRILKAERSQLTSVELFCGAGGLALGMHNAGLNNRLLVDFDRDAIATIKRNRPKWNAVHASVNDISLHEYHGAIDVMAGGFPCQAFSYAGNKRGFGDARGTLFYEFARLIDQVKPRLVIGENVRGLLAHDGGRTLDTMISILDEIGYEVRYSLLRAQFLDVPQKRERLVIFASRRGQGEDIAFPKEKEYVISLSEALRNVPESPGMEYSQSKHDVLAMVPPGGYWKDLPEETKIRYMGGSYGLPGGKTGMARRLSWDEPSLTLTCNPAQKQTERCHPSETRPLTVREYARIQTFPDTWLFEGSVSSQYRQIGNAVPVNLGYHIGLAAREILGEPAVRAAGRSQLRVEGLPMRQLPLEGLAVGDE